ncbi:MAG: Branched-chain amino acid ATP-binding cassette transporter, partial [Actinomycetota bacterium]|nr:Branched-chain amino acid ATP-binding cassette transporter [Actinomycetota bacterium]
ADGPPDVVRNDPGVVAAYLGGANVAIVRSGTARRRRRAEPLHV